MMRADKIGLYVHIPFCVKKCNYCDFCSFPVACFENRGEYIDALCEEILSYGSMSLTVDTVFFGGGTPMLLSVGEFDKIASAIRKAFVVAEDCEFTLEANPRTVTEEKLSAFVKQGVNRISIGLQSIHENELKTLGRIHSYEDFIDSYRIARACGIRNINVDLMYGIPEQTAESFEKTLETVLELSPEHISLYGLILEEGTPFFEARGELPLPSEDEECDMYYTAAKLFRSRGYSHYEISNYAKPGLECRHNLKYWRNCDYIGVGVAAYSCFRGSRFGNTRVVSDYLSAKKRVAESTALSLADKAYEYVMLGLRTSEGISLSEYKHLFGEDFLKTRKESIAEFSSAGLLSVSGDRLSLSEKGFYVSNHILTELI